MSELVEIIPVNEKDSKQLLEDFHGERTGWVLAGPERYCFPSLYKEQADKYLKIQTKPDDVWICTFPRSGTTLTQELVWMILNDCDYEGATKGLWERSPFTEVALFFHPETKAMFLGENEDKPENRGHIENMSIPTYEFIDTLKSPRVLKTHFPPSLLPIDMEEKGGKVLYVARNPKDVVKSYYHLLRLWRTSDYRNTFEHFVNLFMDGLVPWAPFWSHVQEGWERRHQDNYLFLFYEDMVKDMKGTIRAVAKFVNKPMTDQQVDRLADHLHISNFKSNPAVNFEILRDVGILSQTEQGFIRQGNDRGCATELTGELSARLNQWIEEHYDKTDLRFPAK